MRLYQLKHSLILLLKVGVGAGVFFFTILKEKRLALATNNMAEYSALILGLELARKMGIKTLKVIGYSDLIVNQVKGVYWAKIID